MDLELVKLNFKGKYILSEM